MEFKFRAVDDRPASSSSTVRYFSSERTIRGQSVLPSWAVTSPPPSSDSDPVDYFTIHDPILHPTNARDAMLRQMEKDRIREEILAARRRVLEAEVMRELKMEREIALKKAIGDGLGFDDPFGPMQAHSFGFCSPTSSPLAPLPELVPDKSEVNMELTKPAGPPELSNDKLIVLAKPNPNLSGLKRKDLPSEGDNDILQSRSKKRKKKNIPKEEWSCALCLVTVSNEKILDGHLNGKRHRRRLGAENIGKCSWSAPLSENTAKNFEPKELETTDAASSQLGAKEERSLLDHNEASDGSDKKMQDTDTSEEEKVELPVQKDQGGDDVEVETVHMMQRKEEPTKSKRFEFLCEICKVGSNDPKVMEKHRRAKKHMDKLKELKENKGRSTKEDNVNTPTTKCLASSGPTQEPVKRLQQDTENSVPPSNVNNEANTSISTTIAAASLVTTKKEENARLQDSLDVTREANVSSATINSMASSVATQEAVEGLQQGIDISVAPANVIEEANALIPTRIAVAPLVAVKDPETARLQESVNVTNEANVSIRTAVAMPSWGAGETKRARLLQESIKQNIPTTIVTKEAKANMPTTTSAQSAALESHWRRLRI